ncbi:hypothetical protein Tco_0992503 [Tanacetum coccineum]|uniref:Retrotransposon protein n=1 Tax=Tanacetum coccineum TaxID=301880 RepID=A0ABQ5F2S2_9ASTR
MENSKRSSLPMQENPNFSKAQVDFSKILMKLIGLLLKIFLDKDDTKSQSRYVFVLNVGAVDWKSAKKRTIAMSSTKAEYIAAAEASMEGVWIRNFIDGLGNVVPTNKRPMEMLCDNMPIIAIANDLEIMKGAKHYQRKYHYIHEVIQDGEIVLKKVHTYDNVVDPFTKLMPYTKHFEHAMETRVRPASSLM